MTAEELQNDITLDAGTDIILMNYKSLNKGDILILQDTIDNITYDSVSNSTEIKFEFTLEGTIPASTAFRFEGNLTTLYHIGDEVNITLHVTEKTFDYSNKSYNMEAFEERWLDPDSYMKTIYPLIPKEKIKKA